MLLPLSQLFAQLETNQASLILYLFICAMLIIGLVINFSYFKQTPSTLSRRLTIGFLVMLLVEFVSFALTTLLIGDTQLSAVWLPPLDRFQMGFILLWLMWIWAFPNPSPWVDALTVLLSLGLFGGLILTLSIWSTLVQQTGFNAHWLDLAWQVLCLEFLILMTFIIFAKRDRLWGAGVLTCLLLIVGHALQIITPNLGGNFAGPVRLVSLIAFPIMLILPQRFIVQPSSSHLAGLRQGTDRRDRRRYSTELRTALGFLNLAWEENPQVAKQQLVKSFGQALLADVCLFTTRPNPSGQVTILAGYDFSRNLRIDEITLSGVKVPMVSNALTKSHSLRLPEDHDDTPDVASLCKIIKHDGDAPVLVHPVSISNAWGIGGIILMTPFSRRAWVAEDTLYVAGMVEALVHIIEHNQAGLDTSGRIQKLTAELTDSGQHIAKLQQRLDELSLQLETIQLKKTDTKTDTIKLEPLVVAKHEADQQIARLRSENAALRDQIIKLNGYSGEEFQLHENQQAKELRLSLEEVAHLQNMLAVADMKVNQLERKMKAST